MARSSAAKVERKAVERVKCYCVGCSAKGRWQLVLYLTAAPEDPPRRLPIPFTLCDKHRKVIPDAKALWKKLPTLWDVIVDRLKPSGRVPLKSLARVEYESTDPPKTVH
jgi:hypothetical protein